MTSSRRVPTWLLLLGAMTAIGPLAIDMYLPAFPIIEREFGATGVERTMAGYMIGIALGQLFYGPISDRFGRKPPLYAGFILYSIGALGCMAASNMTMLILARVIQALGGCAGIVIARAIVRDRCQPHEAARAFSTLMLIVSLAPILAPSLGGWFITWMGWRSVFAFQSLVGVALMTAMHFVLDESRDPAHVVPLDLRNVLVGYGRLLSDRPFIGYTLIGAFGMGAGFSYIAGSPTILIPQYDLTPQQYGWVLGLNGVAFMSANRLNMIALRTSGPAEQLARTVVYIPIAAAVFLLLTSLAHPPLWSVVVLQICFFVTIARANPNIAALAMAPHGRTAGSAAALMGSLQSTGPMLGASAVAAFSNGTVRRLATIMLVGACLSALSYLWARSARRGNSI